jgi:hypothetical protein
VSRSFPETVQHIALNERCAGYGSRDVLDYSLKLNRICPQIFPDLQVSILVNRFGRSELPIYVALFSTLRP